MTSITARRASATGDSPTEPPGRWSAVYAMALCSFALVASEFMPVSLLSPIARTLRLTEGQAGQAISISGVFAVVTSLCISMLLGQRDRRRVMLALTALLVVSGSLVAFAPSYPVFMLGRALLGIAIGGFWSMSAAVAMRLVPRASVAKALAVVNGGTALATVLAAPLGSYIGGLVGWRGAFFCVVPVAVAAIVWQAFSMPRLPFQARAADGGMFALLRQRSFLLGLAMWVLLFTGQFTLFTYLRPFLEQITRVGPALLSFMLLILGVSGFVGTILMGRLVDTALYTTLCLLPAVLAVAAAALALSGSSVLATAPLLAVWGFVFTAAPVAWWTWLARTAPDDAEAGGGLLVAAGQLSITLGATLGGIVFDSFGPVSTFWTSAGMLAFATVATLASTRMGMRRSTTAGR